MPEQSQSSAFLTAVYMWLLWAWWVNSVGSLSHFYPMCITSLQRAVVLAAPILGSLDAGWQATLLTHKQINALTQGAQDNLEDIWVNKWRTLPCNVIIPLLERHQGRQVRGSVASQMNQLGNKPKNQEPEVIEPIGLVHAFSYIFPQFT